MISIYKDIYLWFLHQYDKHSLHGIIYFLDVVIFIIILLLIILITIKTKKNIKIMDKKRKDRIVEYMKTTSKYNKIPPKKLKFD
jgi:hypothetical protein